MYSEENEIRAEAWLGKTLENFERPNLEQKKIRLEICVVGFFSCLIGS